MSQEPIINGYLRQMLSMGGSDLHLSIDYPAKARIHGNIIPLDDNVITPEFMEELLSEIYGEVSLQSVVAKNGHRQLVMVNEGVI